MPVRIACGQLNQTVGDFSGNVDRIEQAARDAVAAGAQILLTPELSLSGYPPEDLLFRDCILCKGRGGAAKSGHDIGTILRICTWSSAIPSAAAGHCHNAAAVLKAARQVGEYLKQELPNYSVFDEIRYFTPGDRAAGVRGRRRALRHRHLRGLLAAAGAGDGARGRARRCCCR